MVFSHWDNKFKLTVENMLISKSQSVTKRSEKNIEVITRRGGGWKRGNMKKNVPYNYKTSCGSWEEEKSKASTKGERIFQECKILTRLH